MADNPGAAHRQRDRVVAILLVLLGATSWILVAKLGGRREAWDSELYWQLLLALAVVIGVVSWFIPVRTWRWAFLPFLGQAAAAFVQNPTANLMPLGLIMFGFLGAICLIPAVVGSRLRLARETRKTQR